MDFYSSNIYIVISAAGSLIGGLILYKLTGTAAQTKQNRNTQNAGNENKQRRIFGLIVITIFVATVIIAFLNFLRPSGDPIPVRIPNSSDCPDDPCLELSKETDLGNPYE